MRFYFLILAVIFIVPVIAAEKSQKSEKAAKKSIAVKDTTDETSIKIEGVLEVGIDINNKVNRGETDYNKIGKGKIEISARPVKKVRAEFSFEYSNKDSSFTIDKLYGLYNFADFGAIRAGYMKKAFGLEEKAGVEERYFHKRSIINDGLEDFNFLGHDLTFQYRHKLGKNLRLIGGFSFVDTNLCLQNYSFEYETKKTNVILATIIRHYTPPEKTVTTFVSSFSFKRIAELFVSEAELTFGLNPRIKSLDEENAFIFGARVQEYFPINTGLKSLRQIIPIAEASIYSEDIESGIEENNIDAQLKAGLTLGFAKNSAFQWRNTYGNVLRIRDGKSNIHRRRFDSEVVVIF